MHVRGRHVDLIRQLPQFGQAIQRSAKGLFLGSMHAYRQVTQPRTILLADLCSDRRGEAGPNSSKARCGGFRKVDNDASHDYNGLHASH